MVFVWAKQETVLAVFKKCPRCLVYVRQYANVFSVGPCLYCINREDRRYTKKMTLANKSAIFFVFRSFYNERLLSYLFLISSITMLANVQPNTAVTCIKLPLVGNTVCTLSVERSVLCNLIACSVEYTQRTLR